MTSQEQKVLELKTISYINDVVYEGISCKFCIKDFDESIINSTPVVRFHGLIDKKDGNGFLEMVTITIYEFYDNEFLTPRFELESKILANPNYWGKHTIEEKIQV
jgi:hypothetical protein